MSERGKQESMAEDEEDAKRALSIVLGEHGLCDVDLERIVHDDDKDRYVVNYSHPKGCDLRGSTSLIAF